MRVTADTADRPGHCATVVGRGEREDKRGEYAGKGNGVETERKEEPAKEREEKQSRRGG